VPVIAQQIDCRAGGDGIVARGDIRNINDFRMKDGKRRKVVLAQNSPSHYLIMSLLIDAGNLIPPRWTSNGRATRRRRRKFCTGPVVRCVRGLVAGHLQPLRTKCRARASSSPPAAPTISSADTWAVRNDFLSGPSGYCRQPRARNFEGVDMVRKDIPAAAQALSKAYGIPVEDCTSMIGKDGGVAEGDAH